MDLIIGGGKYGCNAVEYLRGKNRSFILLDADPKCQCVRRFELPTSPELPSNGEYFMQGNLEKAIEIIDLLKPEYIFPTAPIHIAADMAKIKFALAPWPEIINCILSKLPQAVVLHAGSGKIVVSFNRDSHCQESCSMPETCPTSQIKKPCSMTRLMEYACPEAFILISHSMAPGMGALKGSELAKFFSWAAGRAEFVVGTACDCHGVFSAFKSAEVS